MSTGALWYATKKLRAAESLAGIAGCVSGPADSPPSELTSAWLDDWIERARRTIDRAYEDAKKEADTIRERAKKIAENVESGATALKNLPGRVVDTARDALEQLVSIAQKIQWAMIFGGVVATAILAALFARYMGWI